MSTLAKTRPWPAPPQALKALTALVSLTLLTAGLLCGTAARADEAMPQELPSMRTPVPEAPASRTRAEVREALATARQTRLITPDGDIGDTPEVLALRETFNALQTEVLQAAPAAAPPAVAASLPVMSIGELFALMDRAAADGGVVLLMLGRER